MREMIQSAKNALLVVLAMKTGENVLVVTDERKKSIGDAFIAAAQELGAHAKLYVLPEDRGPIKDVPEDLANDVQGNAVIVNAFEAFPEETPFRIKLIKQEIKTNARIGHAPGITTSMMTDGPMNVDYEKVAAAANDLIAKFDDAETVHIVAPSGTDIVLDIKARSFDTDVKIKPGAFGNLPAGEIWCAPVEDGANGILVTDGSIGDLGRVQEPLHMRVRFGRIMSIKCGDTALEKRVRELTTIDDMASVIGELGIGLNPGARLTGNLLEDEKAGGTAHIAFGNNQEMPNGKNSSKTHRDFLFYKPTFTVRYKDGTQRVVIEGGKVV